MPVFEVLLLFTCEERCLVNILNMEHRVFCLSKICSRCRNFSLSNSGFTFLSIESESFLFIIVIFFKTQTSKPSKLYGDNHMMHDDDDGR